MDWTPALSAAPPAIAAAVGFIVKYLSYRTRVRAMLLATTQEQRDAIAKLEPSFLVKRSGGGAILLLAISGGLAAWQGSSGMLAQRARHATDSEISGQPAAECNGTNCPAPAKCVGGRCQDTAKQPDPPMPARKLRPKHPPPARADAGPPLIDSRADHPSWWDARPGVFADRGGSARWGG